MRIDPSSAVLIASLALAAAPSAGVAQQPTGDGPYKVLLRARVGGEGGTDYLHANALDGRLYITRNAVRAVPATDSTPSREAVPGRVTVFDLKTLKPVGEILNGGGNPTTGNIYVMSVERGPAPPVPAGGRGGAAPVIPGSFTILMIGKQGP